MIIFCLINLVEVGVIILGKLEVGIICNVIVGYVWIEGMICGLI